jgi:hypothetical protein
MSRLPEKKRSDHYVPQFYLNEFSCVDDVTTDPRIWVYDIENPVPKKIRTNRIAKIKNFYRLFEDGSIDDSLDKALQYFESEVAPIFRKLRREDISLENIHSRYKLGRFISFLLARTPQFREHINLFFQNNTKAGLIDYLNTNVNVEKELQMLNEGRRQRITKQEFVSSFNKLKINLAPGSFQFVLIESAKRMIVPVCSMKWLLLRSNEAFPFVTSDAPVVVDNPEATDPSVWYGYEKRTAKVIFPMNRNLCLLTAWTGREGYYKVDEDVVFDMNSKIASHAMRYLFSPIQYPISVVQDA